MTTADTQHERTITGMLTGVRPMHSATFIDAALDAELVSAEATIEAGDDHTPFLASVLLPQADDRKIERLDRWMQLLPGRLDMIRGQFRATDDVVRLNIRAASEGRLVLVAAEFSRRAEPAATRIIDTGIEHLAPAGLVGQLVALRRGA